MRNADDLESCKERDRFSPRNRAHFYGESQPVELRSMDSRGRLSPHRYDGKTVAGRGKFGIFTAQKSNPSSSRCDTYPSSAPNSASGAGFAQNAWSNCTKSGHPPVNALHSIENTGGYEAPFFVDWIYRRSTTGSFFDSFLSFAGWCGVRGSSGVTFPIARWGKRASKGL
jgi:hypothetical protein